MSLTKSLHQRWLSVLFMLCFSVQVSAELLFYSENYPPFNFKENHQPRGISVELLDLIFKDIDAPYSIRNIQMVPWPRGYERVQRQADSVLFSTFRTPAREAMFKWVGPIATTQNVLIGKASERFPLTDTAQLQGYRVGVIRNDIGGLLLEEMNVSGLTIITLSDPDTAAKMLDLGRIDLWAYDLNVANSIQNRLGLRSDLYQVVLPLGEPGELYFAFNPATDDQIVNTYQLSLERVKQKHNMQGQNLFQQILQRYHYQSPAPLPEVKAQGISGE
ncbi:substrate-binding periplasmic protein [Neptuniibacter halophilus]|uniref:substrate-binding periplasmic protein n=1 Tax=Neptuniibacter halophilus TaxID=651666 RepID=UPI002573CE11|nr:transporter substrate-binding domain-containing protein [Neptuniibacter halophilus]